MRTEGEGGCLPTRTREERPRGISDASTLISDSGSEHTGFYGDNHSGHSASS